MSWSEVPLSELVDIKGGGTPSKKVAEYWGGTIPWVSVKDFKSRYIDSIEDFITEAGVKNSATNLIDAGCIIIPTRMALGKVAITTAKVAINQDIKALIVKDDKKVRTDYLSRYLESKADFIIQQGKGATVKGITLDVLRNLLVPVPDIKTQKLIATALEKADLLRQQCQQMDDELNALAQSVFLEMFGDPIVNPKGHIKKLRDVLEKIESGWSPKCQDQPASENEWGVLKLGAITSGAYVSQENKAMLDGDEPRKEYEVKSQDLLFCRKNTKELVGTVAYVRDTRAHLSLPDLIFRFVPKASEKVSKLYLWGLFSNSNFKAKVQALASGAAASMQNISKAKLMDLEIPVPSTTEQEAYERVMDELWRQSISRRKQAEQAEELFSSLMQRAFKGELDLKPLAK